MEIHEYDTDVDFCGEAALNILMLNESSFAEVIDFSERGVTCRVFTGDAARKFEESGVDLFNCFAGQYLKGLPCKVAYSMSCETKQGKKVSRTRIYQLEFPDLSDEKRKELEKFIEDGYQYFALYGAEEH